jgi:ferredoxin
MNSRAFLANNNVIETSLAEVIFLDVKVNQDLCISCGLCVSSCPEVFSWNNAEKAEAVKDPVQKDIAECVEDAAHDCPTDAIETN